ncbi:hypothetical protein [Clostridium saccharoperbutylacetonicum]|uniref:hypothetical protein n=1 Tax=Clostridium saccharoperbutylacetonicum TaxID=36745 RepID=UPI0039E92714
MEDLLEKLLKEQAEIKRIRAERDKNCSICNKDLSNETFILVKNKKVSCKEHFKPGEDEWKLDIIV